MDGDKNMAQKKYPLFPSTRFSVYLMLFLTSLLQYAGRFALNMSIVCMVVPGQQQLENNTQQDDHVATIRPQNTSLDASCEPSVNTKKDFGYEGEFLWSRPQVGYILAAFFYAYIPMQLCAGWLADRFGIRHLLGTGMLIGGVLNLLTPVAARLHYGLLIALRVVMGFAMGVVFPCVHSLVGKWVPTSERATYFGLVFSGPSAGTIISFILSGYLCQFSWTIVFYLLGGIMVVWYAGFLYVVYSSPDEHPRITDEEKQYISTSNSLFNDSARKPRAIPWKHMLTSKSVIGLCTTHFAVIWLIYTLSAGVPLYLQDVMYFNIKENGVLSSIPHVTTVICSLLFGILFDVVHRKLIRSRRMLRNTAETLFAVVVIACIVALGFMDCNQKIAANLMICLSSLAICWKRGGSICSPTDLAPRMAGIVYGLTNFVANFSGFLSPIAIGHLTKSGSRGEWQSVFLLTAGLVVVGWLSFVLCVTSEEEAWARGAEEVATEPADEDEDGLKMNIKLAIDKEEVPTSLNDGHA